MKTLVFRFSFLAMLIAGGLFALPAQAQVVSLGADVMSRYIWRGADFGESASIQPALVFSASGLEVGAWASYAVAPESAPFNEIDLWVGYGVETDAGTFSAGVTDYYFPNAGVALFDFSDGGAGAHWIEPYLGYEGPAAFPISLFAGMFVYNDPDHSIYLEASYPFTVDGVALAVTAGASARESTILYGTEGFGLINLGLSASKTLPITDAFGLPVTVGFIVNPEIEKSYLVFGVSF